MESKEKVIHEYLTKVIEHNYKCAHCDFLNYSEKKEPVCFFAYDCVANDFKYYNEGD